MNTLKLIGVVILLLIAAYFGWYIYRIAVGLMFFFIFVSGGYLGYKIARLTQKKELNMND